MIWLYFLSTNEGSMSAVSARVTDAPSTLAHSLGPVHSERWKIIIFKCISESMERLGLCEVESIASVQTEKLFICWAKEFELGPVMSGWADEQSGLNFTICCS